VQNDGDETSRGEYIFNIRARQYLHRLFIVQISDQTLSITDCQDEGQRLHFEVATFGVWQVRILAHGFAVVLFHLPIGRAFLCQVKRGRAYH
jgi:hypothetical protein